jgi:hypothetical protein
MSAPVEVSIGEDGVGSGQLTVESDEEYKFFFTSEEGYTVISKEIELPGPKKQVSPSNWDKFCAWWGKWSNVLYLVLSGICVLVWLTTAVYVVGYLYNVTTTPYQGSVREKRDKFAQRYEARGKPVPQTQINKLYPETNHFSGARASFGAIATLVTIPVLFVGFILCFIDDVVRFVKRRLDEVKGIAGWLEGREGVKPITMRHHLVENPGLVTYLVDGAEVVADKLSSLFTTRRALPTATQPAANAGVPWFQLVTSNLVGEIIEAAIKQMFSSERRLK